MGVWEEQLPVLGMVSLEFVYAIMIVLNKQALSQGLSSRILIFYRQSCATLVTFPMAFLLRKESSNARMDVRLFLMIFMSSFIGVTLFENLYIEGLRLASSSVTSAMFNLVPALTFLLATILGLEQMKLNRLSDIAKMFGTILCAGGAIAITFLKGQKLFMDNAQALQDTHSWLLGCVLLFGGVSCLSSWLILQVPITKRYPNYLSLSAWTCLFSMLQTGVIAFFMERDPQAWVLSSGLEIAACLFSGVVVTGAKYCIQCWCIARKGPLFVATFSPLKYCLHHLLRLNNIP
uniref:WAT1-related protein n=1 Tax=Opuntia streptacantha TaxID=393608 RepID=A0A7C9AVK2_OPUST